MNINQTLTREIVIRLVIVGLILLSISSTKIHGQDAIEVVPPNEAELVEAEPVDAADPVQTEREDQAPKNTDSEIRFSFNAAPWREVIEWVALQADMPLQYAEMPTGSFSYQDDHAFTADQAIDRINLFLIPQGYSLVRSGNLLALINLSDARSLAQLDALAELVDPARLTSLDPYRVVKCLFKLSELDADTAVDELSALQLMTMPKVLPRTNQLMITDTVAKLQSVRAILNSFEPSTMSNGTVVKSFKLQHVDAEDVLVVARPHLGLATDEMIGIDVSLSADTQGKSIFATGVEDKIKLIEGLVQAIDQPDAGAQEIQSGSILKSYLVEGGNVELVYDVLQTLLAGKSVRLSIDEAAGSIVALADEATQREIELTVAELKASDAAFEVISLKSVDAYYAIGLLEEMLDLVPSLDDDDDEPAPNLPKIDADAANRRLFVRAKQPQIDQIKAIIADLEASQPSSGDENLRRVPMSPSQSAKVLKMAIPFWQGANSVKQLPSATIRPVKTERIPAQYSSERNTKSETQRPEEKRRMVPPSVESRLDTTDSPIRQSSSGHSLASVQRASEDIESVDLTPPSIHFQITEQGLLLQSHDVEALNRFEELIRVVSGPTNTIPAAPIVFYLQYIRSDDALRMLAKLLDGGDSLQDITEASLVNGYVSTASSLLSGSFLSTSNGTMTLTMGATTVVSDTRLNRLIAQGTTEEIDSIEDYLRIIDKPVGATDVLTYGRSNVIELMNIKASEAAEVIRQAFGDRVVSNDKSSDTGNSTGRSAPDPKASKTKPDDEKKAESPKVSEPKDLAPKMTVAVHEPSNSLIVTAPDSLLEQVDSLIKKIDSRGEQAIEVIVPTNVLAVEAALQGLMIETSSSGRSSSSSSRDSRSRSER
ncbi:secretin N-terminal domain-containing protein [Neorhodopirellula pilleata]|uniref:Bacterial type II/III secretion system short domain protein n=1 Tax=Neorhodopirellula pilleata TaxID=2714738 RepID=A0A5C6AWW5_9BACT|nr:secretin N-terminal domain-containing protein [Neorhodopirellula pilleata]TWU04128.1 Bacterial type II/III secretion system short domain protein [Neorhodopirellula pilleata]